MKTLVPEKDTQEQLVVLKYPSFRLKLATLQNSHHMLGHFITTGCSETSFSHKIGRSGLKNKSSIVGF